MGRALINTSVESLELFIERSAQVKKSLPLTRGSLLYSSGLDVPANCMQTLLQFPEHFSDKLLVVQPGIDDRRKKGVNDEFARKIFSVCAAFLGYSNTGRGFKMPKTRLSLDFTDFTEFKVSYVDQSGEEKQTSIMASTGEEAIANTTKLYGATDVLEAKPYRYSGTHIHDRSLSWSHRIMVNMARKTFESFIRTLVHEMIHGQQHTKRRLTRSSSGQMMWDRQEVEIISPEDDSDGYYASPWEVEAHTRAPEVTAEIMSYLRSGVARGGFNPKRI